MPPPSRFDMDGDVAGIAAMSGGVTDDDDEYDGRQLDKLWKWTGLITAAKMGVSTALKELNIYHGLTSDADMRFEIKKMARISVWCGPV